MDQNITSQNKQYKTTIISNFSIICLSSMEWDEVWTSKQHIMSLLSESNRVYYIERPVSIFALLRPSRWYKLKRWWRKYNRINEKLTIIYPPPIISRGSEFPFISYLFPFFNSLNTMILRRFIKSIKKDFGLEKFIFWSYEPYAGNLIPAIKPFVSVYHCVDDFSSYPGAAGKSLAAAEETLIKNSDIVLVVNKSLLASKTGLNMNTHIIPHGVDIAFLNEVAGSAELPVAKTKGLVFLCFTGTISELLDFKILKHILEERKNFRLFLIGPVAPRFISRFGSFREDLKGLLGTGRAFLLGKKDKKEIPGLLAKMDVCLIPYVLDYHIKNCFPTKMFEYLALGKPVVSVEIPVVREYESVIHIAEGKEQFLSSIDRALETAGDTALMERRKAVARDSTWITRVEQISRLITDHIMNAGK